jgi:hypothetical protein
MTYKEKITELMHFLDRELQATIKYERFTIDDYDEVDTWDEDKCAQLWNAFFICGNFVIELNKEKIIKLEEKP